jgi:DNA-binding transcriptional ArsR family regulator
VVARAATTTDPFNAVGDPQRRRILVALAGGETSVSSLVESVSLPQPAVSKHLAVLRQVDLVRCRVSGRQRLYRLNEPALEPIHDWLRSFASLWSDRLDRIDDIIKEDQ